MATQEKPRRTRVCGPRRKRSGPVHPDLPYTMNLPDGRKLCVEVPGRWVTLDRDGSMMLLPDGVSFLDRLRALFSSTLDRAPSPGYIVSLRQAMGLTQQQFGQRTGVDKMTVYRWERGTVRPSMKAIKGIEKLRKKTTRRGVTIET